MASALNVLDKLYLLLNKTELISVLGGGAIYKNLRPTNSEKNDIVLNVNFLNGEHKTGVLYGVANINIYAKTLQNGQSDTIFFDTVFSKIEQIFEKSNYENRPLYFSIENTALFPEIEQVGWFYMNIRLQVQYNN